MYVRVCPTVTVVSLCWIWESSTHWLFRIHCRFNLKVTLLNPQCSQHIWHNNTPDAQYFNNLEKELFHVLIHLSVVFKFRLTRHKRLYCEVFFTSIFHLDHKNKLQWRNNDRNRATTVCRSLDTCTRVLALRGTTKWPERGFATVNKADKLQPGTLTAAGQYPVRFYIKRHNTASTSTESHQRSH